MGGEIAWEAEMAHTHSLALCAQATVVIDNVTDPADAVGAVADALTKADLTILLPPPSPPPPSTSPSPPPPAPPPPAPPPPTLPPPSVSPLTQLTPIPAHGVQVLRGDSEDPVQVVCLRPGDEAVTSAPWGRETIATNCCTRETPGEPQRCRRRSAAIQLTSPDNDSCVVGKSEPPPDYIEPLTYGEAVERCAAFGYEICKKSCVNGGCLYNLHPVYTSLPC